MVNMTVPNDANTYLAPVIQIPSALEIIAITQSNPMLVTVSANSDQVNTYIPGQLVRFNIPATFGMQQLNGMVLEIFLMSDPIMSFEIDSRLFDAFNLPGDGTGPATLAPSGSRNLEYNNLTRNVPFQSFNDRGN